MKYVRYRIQIDEIKLTFIKYSVLKIWDACKKNRVLQIINARLEIRESGWV